MLKISTTITDILSPRLEDALCEIEECHWSIEKIDDKTPPSLIGYFDDEAQAQEALEFLRQSFPELPEVFEKEILQDSDWKNEYKKHLTAWNVEDLHWVPVWMRPDYQVPAGDKVFYFDAGLAFGTGDHPTTRLCAQAMLKYKKRVGDVSDKFIVDAGCGSGILALSAKLEGFGKILGFDRDPEAVRVSAENAVINSISLEGVEFVHAGLEKALNNISADVVIANIQADVLCVFADALTSAVKTGGELILSGILATENDQVKAVFEEKLRGKIKSCESFVMGDWSSLEIILN